MTVKSARPNRIDWLIALALAAAALALYASTIAPDVLPGDAGEFQFAAWRLGLSHPTGYPLYMLLGTTWQHALAAFGFSPALALNGLSAAFAALAVATLYLFMLAVPLASPLARRLVAAFSALLLAANLTFWSQALIAEVYTLHALLLLALLYALQRAAAPSPEDASTTVIITDRLAWVALIFGLSLAHHAMTLLVAPAVLLYLWIVDRTWWRFSPRKWPAMMAVLLLPLMLYAYIPLRGGPAASPWYHQPLGDATLSLYQNDLASFLNFITGRSISVGFYGAKQAFASIPQAGQLWLDHFGWIGFALMLLGIFALARGQRPLLWLTAGIAVAQQAFNLFYAIGDIRVYYIPLYITGTIWAGYGAALLVDRIWQHGIKRRSSRFAWQIAAILFALLLFLLPLRAFIRDRGLVDQSANTAARVMWEQILAALPSSNAILISNDRDEIPPLFYLQYVEGQAPGVTALHPLMAPDERFADIGATVDTALSEGDGAPVYLIKPMPGLEIKYDLSPAAPPVVRVDGLQASDPAIPVDTAFDGLTLLGYDWEPSGDQVLVRLHWLVNAPLDADYTTSVQLFDVEGNRLAQNDSPPGGVYYPTSLWKPGERLVEAHTLTPAAPLPTGPLTLQISMYTGPELRQLAAPVQFPINGAAPE